MWLLIDDTRNLNTEAIARTSVAAYALLSLKCWECICFDHDLGEDTTGYDILVKSIEYNLLPGHVQLVTSNPVGRLNMRNALETDNYTTTDGSNFYRM